MSPTEVNLLTRKPIELLPDRTVETVAKWLKKYPQIRIVSRDRSGAYAIAVKKGAPKAKQIADRWHLLKNITEALDDLLFRYKKDIKSLTEKMLFSENKPDDELMLNCNVETQSNARIINKQKYNAKYEDWLNVKKLFNEGFSIRNIAKKTGLHRVTVKKYIINKEFTHYTPRTPKSHLMEKWIDWLLEQIKSESTNATLLWKKMCELGFNGSVSTVRQFVAKCKKNWLYQDSEISKKIGNGLDMRLF